MLNTTLIYIEYIISHKSNCIVPNLPRTACKPLVMKTINNYSLFRTS